MLSFFANDVNFFRLIELRFERCSTMPVEVDQKSRKPVGMSSTLTGHSSGKQRCASDWCGETALKGTFGTLLMQGLMGTGWLLNTTYQIRMYQLLCYPVQP